MRAGDVLSEPVGVVDRGEVDEPLHCDDGLRRGLVRGGEEPVYRERQFEGDGCDGAFDLFLSAGGRNHRNSGGIVIGESFEKFFTIVNENELHG